MSRPVTPVDPSLWVDAAPFAAHLLHLSASSGVPWAMVAAHAHVPLRAAERLVGVPGTRRLRKLPRALAQRLLAIDPVELSRLRSVWVAAGPASNRVAELVARGVPVTRVARVLVCSPDLVARLADGTPASVPADIALRARVAAETADRALLRRATRAA